MVLGGVSKSDRANCTSPSLSTPPGPCIVWATPQGCLKIHHAPKWVPLQVWTTGWGDRPKAALGVRRWACVHCFWMRSRRRCWSTVSFHLALTPRGKATRQHWAQWFGHLRGPSGLHTWEQISCWQTLPVGIGSVVQLSKAVFLLPFPRWESKAGLGPAHPGGQSTVSHEYSLTWNFPLTVSRTESFHLQ